MALTLCSIYFTVKFIDDILLIYLPYLRWVYFTHNTVVNVYMWCYHGNSNIITMGQYILWYVAMRLSFLMFSGHFANICIQCRQQKPLTFMHHESRKYPIMCVDLVYMNKVHLCSEMDALLNPIWHFYSIIIHIFDVLCSFVLSPWTPKVCYLHR